MGKTQKIIEINGMHYDAVTGALISHSHAVAEPAAKHHPKHSVRQGSLDGFSRRSRDQITTALAPKPKPAAIVPMPATTKQAVVSHATVHKPQKSVTLMRSAVKKPAIKSATVIKAQTRTDLLAKTPVQAVVPKLSYGNVDKRRHQRAERLVKSSAVKHFSTVTPVVRLTNQHPVAIAVPARDTAFDFMALGSKPGAHIHSIPRHASVPSAVAIKENRSSASLKPRSADIFEQALAVADSHEQTFEAIKKPKSIKRNRTFSLVGASLALLLLVGFFGYQNVPQISLKVASYRSGLQAKLPTYQPGDFAFKDLEYTPGNVVASYASPSSNQRYDISQRASNWDSQALLSNVTTTAKSNYKTYQQAGRTVYIIGNDTATWVDSGILYTVKTAGSLTSSQLLDLARSM